MLLVKAWVGVSNIHGFGLIAHEFIPKGTVVWKLVPGFDFNYLKTKCKSSRRLLKVYLHITAFFTQT